jgi:hypothetical protein
MRHTALLLVLLSITVAPARVAAEGDPAEELRREADRAFDQGKPEEGRRLLRDLIARFPDSPMLPGALDALAHRNDGSLAGRGEALGCLRRLVRGFPMEYRPATVAARAAEIGGWEWTRLPSRLRPDARATIAIDPEKPCRRTFRLRRVPAGDLALWFADASLDVEQRRTAPAPAGTPLAERVVETTPLTRSAEVVFDLSAPGDYEIEEEVEGFAVRAPVQVARVLFTCRVLAGKGFVWTADPWSGEPVAGATVSVRRMGVPLSGTTGEDGLFAFRAQPPLAVTVTKDDEVHGAFVEGEEPLAGPDVYVTTDRPVYRPGQTVWFKAIRRDLWGSGPRLPGAKGIRLSVRDPEGRVMWSAAVPFSEAGSAAGSFALAEETPLGAWAVETDVPDTRTRGQSSFDSFLDLDERPACCRREFQVAAYRKPAITVAVTGAPAAGGRIGARVRAGTWFGGPVAGAEVCWTVTRRWPASTDEAPGLTVDPRRWFFMEEPGPDRDLWWGYDEEEIAAGEGTAGPEGTLDVSFESEEDYAGAEYVVRAEVTDRTGLFAEGEGTVRDSGAGVRLELLVPAAAAAPGEEIEAVARAIGPDGTPLPDRTVELTALRPSGDDEYESCFSARAETGADGRALFHVPVPDATDLRLKASTPGAPDVRHELQVAFLEPSEFNGLDVTVRPDRYVYETGETARILLRSTRVPVTGLLVVEGAARHEARVVTIERHAQFLELPIRPEHAPNVTVRFTALTGGYEAGDGFELLVYPRDRMIDVGVTSDHPVCAPRDRVRITVTTNVGSGAPVPAEVELAVVDASIFAVEPDRTPDLRRFFHPLRSEGGTGGGDFGLAAAGTFRGTDVYTRGPDFGLAEEGGGGGGGGEEARRFFPDLALWRAQARTGPDGRCEVDLVAPDSLTSWRVLARAVAGPDRFGQGASSIVTRKDVSIRLGVPRAFVVDDEGEVSAVLRSDLGAPARFTVRLEAEGFDVAAPAGSDREVDLGPGEEARLAFRVKAVTPGAGLLRVRAQSPAGGDAMEVTVPVSARGSEEALAVSGRADGTLRLGFDLPEEADPAAARLTVLLTSPAEAVRAALPFLAGYPYGCVEQTMSRFLPAVVAAGAGKRLDLAEDAITAELPDMVAKGLQRLYGYQHDDGGWGWWEHDETDTRMTAYVVLGLAAARDAGFAVDAATLRAAVDCLLGMEATPQVLLARAAAGDQPDLASVEPGGDEDRALLVLAGRRELAAGLPATPPAGDGPEEVRAAALTLRAIHAADPGDPRKAVFVDWLLAHRRGHGWWSTLDTAHVVWALAEAADPAPAERRALVVNGRPVPANGPPVAVVPEYLRAGRNEVVVEGRELFVTALLSWREPARELLLERPGVFEVARRFERPEEDGDGEDEAPVALGRPRTGARVRMIVTVTAMTDQEFILVECPYPAGFEPAPGDPEEEYGDDEVRREVRDDRVCVAIRSMARDDEREFAFDFVAVFPGTWHALPATAFAMYRPDSRGRSAEYLLQID